MRDPTDAERMVRYYQLADQGACLSEQGRQEMSDVIEPVMKHHENALLAVFRQHRLTCTAEDAVQEVWLRVHRTAVTGTGRYDPARGSVRSWLVGIAQRVRYDFADPAFQSDAELMERFCKGNDAERKKVKAEIQTRYREDVERVFRNKGLRPEDVRRLTQQTFQALFDPNNRFDPERCAFPEWVRVQVEKQLQALQGGQPAGGVYVPEYLGARIECPEELPDPPGGNPDLNFAILIRQFLKTRHNPTEREIFEEKYLTSARQPTDKEIAAKVKVTPQYVGNVLTELRHALGEFFAAHGYRLAGAVGGET